jgi:hypothetical protein
MSTDLRDLFPEGVSDETAFNLVSFFANITSEMESHYFVQVRRYINENTPAGLVEYLQNKKKDDSPF